jgi:copper homeostasis protein CutC
MLVPERGRPETIVVKSRITEECTRSNSRVATLAPYLRLTCASQQAHARYLSIMQTSPDAPIAPRTLEIPIDSIEGARLATPFATRLEVCHDLSTEGWTPKMELVRACREAVEGTQATIVAMIRPEFPGCRRELDVAAFATTPKLLDLSLREIESAAAAGAHSVGVSLLTPDGFVDMEANAKLIAHARDFGLVVAFLRTYDLLVDRARGIRDLSALGFTRFITAGVLGWDASIATLDERIAVVRQDVENAALEAKRLGRAPIEVIPGGGVRGANARRWLAISPHLHASCRRDGVIARAELEHLRDEMR